VSAEFDENRITRIRIMIIAETAIIAIVLLSMKILGE
jgi:hypothetical protein